MSWDQRKIQRRHEKTQLARVIGSFSPYCADIFSMLMTLAEAFARVLSALAFEGTQLVDHEHLK